ncbi:prespore-specific protein [Tieghemostelium lacteum]|uniref:Prespore-specific protein n=1 Tax=Tieghemostelium lacteum TaxID=361077 RepID=A0A152A748_TIELA|nr:prespore-specific protein [Tieghemostelium lacteum]|eukprot:KYR02050.1 prespore-specific protein [Tieghemostelium lacteum]
MKIICKQQQQLQQEQEQLQQLLDTSDQNIKQIDVDDDDDDEYLQQRQVHLMGNYLRDNENDYGNYRDGKFLHYPNYCKRDLVDFEEQFYRLFNCTFIIKQFNSVIHPNSDEILNSTFYHQKQYGC